MKNEMKNEKLFGYTKDINIIRFYRMKLRKKRHLKNEAKEIGSTRNQKDWN